MGLASLQPFIVEVAPLPRTEFCLVGWRFLQAVGVGQGWPPVALPEGPEAACQGQSSVNCRVPWLRLKNGERETEDIDPGSDEQEPVEEA